MTPDKKRDASRKDSPFKPRLWQRSIYAAKWDNIQDEEKRRKHWAKIQNNKELFKEHRLKI